MLSKAGRRPVVPLRHRHRDPIFRRQERPPRQLRAFLPDAAVQMLSASPAMRAPLTRFAIFSNATSRA